MKGPAETPKQRLEAVRRIDPGCEVVGHKVKFLNPTREDKKRGSCDMDLETGLFGDFSDPTFKGKGVDTLLNLANGNRRDKAMKIQSPPSSNLAPTHAATKYPYPKWSAANTDNIPHLDSPHGYKHTKTWPYKNAEGQNVMLVARFDKVDGTDKTIRPYRFIQGWEEGDPVGPLPPYNLDKLATRSKDPILVVEGEKTAEAAENLFKDMVCTTSSHGAKSAEKTDWSVMKGRAVTIWPDHDEPGLGYAQDVAAFAYDAGAASVRIVEVPEDFPPKWDLADKPPVGAGLKALLKAAVLVPRPKTLHDHVMSLSDFQAQQIPPREFLVFPWLSAASLNMVYAARGLGKSWFVHKLALCLANGNSFFSWVVKRKSRVLLVDGEMPSATLQKRFRLLTGKHIPTAIDILPSESLWLEGQPLNLNDTETQGRFLTMLEARLAAGLKPDLIIFDNLSSLTSGVDENDNGALDGILKWLMVLRHHGYAVLLVHHAGKGGDQRGASRREDLLDTSIRLAAPQNLSEPLTGACFEISFSKTREERPHPDRLTVQMNTGRDGLAEWKVIQAVSDEVVILQTIRDHAPKSQNKLAELLGISSDTAGKRATPLISRGLVIKNGNSFSLTAKGIAAITPVPTSKQKYT